MAKVGKVKKREVSINSRAARRGAEPIPKDLAAAKTQTKETETEFQPWMHNTQSGGIAKKKKVKQLTRQQKVRQQQAMEKADALAGKLELKVADSKERAKKVKARAKDWEELNEAIVGKKAEDVIEKKMDGESQAEDDGGEKEWEDVEEDVEGDVELPDLEQPVQAHVTDDSVLDAGLEASMDEEVDEVT
ncbi:hypothetical protein LTR08_000303 [Meristemomyces frigidus]|nr:hypothetical protein LTR08_000303 [Meristemomyces frigidus]